MAVRGASQKSVAADLKRNSDIVEMVCQGKPQSEIAKVVGLSQGRVSQIIDKYKSEWIARGEVAISDMIMVETDYIRSFRQEALAAWERSKEDAVTVVSTKTPPRQFGKALKNKHAKTSKKLQLIRQEEKRVGQVGDVACLHIAVECTDKLLRLLNAYPKEQQDTNVNITQINWGDLASPIVNSDVIDVTPSSEVEARIEAEVKSEPSNNNDNGNGYV